MDFVAISFVIFFNYMVTECSVNNYRVCSADGQQDGPTTGLTTPIPYPFAIRGDENGILSNEENNI